MIPSFWLPAFSLNVVKEEGYLFSEVESIDMKSEMSVLDLPDLALECILEKLPPEGLVRMATVCTSLRDICRSAHLWEKHMKNKWERIVWPVASREWKWIFSSRKSSVFLYEGKQNGGLMGHLNNRWNFRSPTRSRVTNINKRKDAILPVNSVMSLYTALETGKFWFHAQVYNCENGNVGYDLSCYDAKLSYDHRTDTFHARYPPQRRRAGALESAVTWDRIRAPPVDTSPFDHHISDCLNDLKPGDHIEVQWRRNEEFPYGWWYGVVGHLETCDGIANHCLCGNSDTLVLDFNQYIQGSHWSRMTLHKYHQEEGNDVSGFYGGIRQCSTEEISMWRKLWPAHLLV